MIVDLAINGHGVYVLNAESEWGVRWVNENVPEPDYAPDYPNSLPVDYRIEELTEGALRDGLAVTLNGELLELFEL